MFSWVDIRVGFKYVFAFVYELKITTGHLFVFDIWSVFEKTECFSNSVEAALRKCVNLVKHYHQ